MTDLLKLTEKEVFQCWQRAQLKTDPGTKDTIDCLTDELNTLLAQRLSEAETVYQATAEHDWSKYKPSSVAKNYRRAKLLCITPGDEKWEFEK